jgi:ABC-type nitrate/sulfonate/bicarbonate transport system permease component
MKTERRFGAGERFLRRWLPPLVLLVAVLAVWEIWVRLAETPTWLLPSPSDIARQLANDRALLARHGWVTVQEVLAGFALALVCGVLLAVAIDASPLVSRAVFPIVIASQAIPIVALAPLLLVWFGYGLAPKVIVTGLVAFFPIVVTTVDGLRSADRGALDLIRVMGGSRWAQFRLVKVPSALPSLFSGARIGVSIAVIGAVFGEYVGANAGLGYLMNISSGRLLTARVFACIVVLATLAIGLFGLVTVLERALLPWRRYLLAEEAGKRG